MAFTALPDDSLRLVSIGDGRDHLHPLLCRMLTIKEEKLRRSQIDPKMNSLQSSGL